MIHTESAIGARRGDCTARRALAVDVDETLSETARFWIEQMSVRFPIAGRSIDDLARAYRYAHRVPEWGGPDLQRAIAELRSCECTAEALPVKPGAIAGVATLSEAFDIEYVTMRSRSHSAATERWLRRHGFPNGEIVTCPDAVDRCDRPLWKARYVESRYPGVAGLIDDDDLVMAKFGGAYRGILFHFGTTSVVQCAARLVQCRDWPSVTAAVLREIPILRVV